MNETKNINNFLQEATNKHMEDCHVFFAFSPSQFKEGIDKLKEAGILLTGEKVTSIGAGGYLPSKLVDKYIKGHKDINKEYKKLKKDEKAKDDYILYQLHNHEVFYTQDIETFCADHMSDIPREDVIKVYKAHNKSACGCNK